MAQTADTTYAFVAEYTQGENALPNRAFVDTLMGEAFRLIYARSGGYPVVLTNLGVAGNVWAFPQGLVSVQRVEWEDSDTELPYKSVAWLDSRTPGWRDDTGSDPSYYTREGRTLVLDCTPEAGTLTVRGREVYGSLSAAFAALPDEVQLAPAYYVLSNLGPKYDQGGALATMFAPKWQEALATALSATSRLESEPYTY
jgi:hypothetical protein